MFKNTCFTDIQMKNLFGSIFQPVFDEMPSPHNGLRFISPVRIIFLGNVDVHTHPSYCAKDETGQEILHKANTVYAVDRG